MDFLPFIAQDAAPKLKRDAFVYFERDDKNFAQCSTCSLQVDGRCLILAKAVQPNDSCAMYVPGEKLSGPEAARMTPEEAGFVRGPVRCENCEHFDNGACLLFDDLNKAVPELFDLNTAVAPQGCCNAWQGE